MENLWSIADSGAVRGGAGDLVQSGQAMSANRLFLICEHHPQIEHSLLIADRQANDVPYLMAVSSVAKAHRADEWFTKHMACGHGCDHFKLALGRTADWDVAPVDHVGGAVRLELLNGGADASH